MVTDLVKRYYYALGGVELGVHGVGSVVITRKNEFIYTCKCGHVENNISTMMAHTSPEPSLEMMLHARALAQKVTTYDEWMRGINEDKYILPPFINWLHVDRPRVAKHP
jgi:hypothetical protein